MKMWLVFVMLGKVGAVMGPLPMDIDGCNQLGEQVKNQLTQKAEVECVGQVERPKCDAEICVDLEMN